MPNTTRGYRYPAQSDPVAQGATAINNLAADCDKFAGASASGVVNITINTANTASSKAVTFPTGRFNAVPVVCCSAIATNPLISAAAPQGISANGFTCYLNRTTTGSNDVQWIARQ